MLKEKTSIRPKEQQTSPRLLGRDFRRLIDRLFDVCVSGTENIPKHGPFLVIITHAMESYKIGECTLPNLPFDAIYASMLIERTTGQHVTWLAADSKSAAPGLPSPLREVIVKIWSLGLQSYGAIPVSLDKKRPLARAKTAINAVGELGAGKIIGLAPSPGKLANRQNFEKGAAFIALGASRETNQPITVLPIRLQGFQAPVRSLLKRKAPAQVTIAEPALVAFNPDRNLKEQVDSVTAKLLTLLTNPSNQNLIK